MRTTGPHGTTATAAQEMLDPLGEALAVVGDRWSPAVVAALLDGPLRYGELQERLPAIAPNILTARLRRLEGEGLIVAAPYSRRPLRFEYSLTDDGAALAGPIAHLAAWAAGHRAGGGGRRPVHASCGTELEVRLWCPACLEVADPDDEEIVRA